MSSASPQIEVPKRGLYFPAVGGAVLLWSAFPPLGLWPLAFVGLFLWLRLIADPETFVRPKSFRAVWLGSLLFWLATDYFVTMPHWAGYFGWVAMSAYLAIYFPFFFAGSLVLVHRYRIPLVIAAPLCWVGMEWLRAHVITGFGMAMLPHTMYRIPILIQTADIIGGYGTSFLMVLLVALVLRASQLSGPMRIVHALAGAAIIGFALVYGAWRMSYQPPKADSVAVALIQGSRDVRFEQTEAEMRRESITQFREYRDLTVAARRRWPDLQLVVWPESAFPQVDPISAIDDAKLTAEQREWILEMRRSAEYCCKIGIGVAPMQGDSSAESFLENTIPLLTGGHGLDSINAREFNSAFLFDHSGAVCFRYHKMHLVMFGEYVPLGDWFPFVYQWMPIPSGLAAGTEPKVFSISGLRFSPSICFESTVGHLIRRQVVELKASGEEPDVLVNLTNDGWFYGSNCLDLHLACNVFRAVELRKPMLVAANTGFSAHVDGSGRLLSVGPRRKTEVLRADVRADGRTSSYLVVGDWPAIAMTIIAVAALGMSWATRKSVRSSRSFEGTVSR